MRGPNTGPHDPARRRHAGHAQREEPELPLETPKQGPPLASQRSLGKLGSKVPYAVLSRLRKFRVPDEPDSLRQLQSSFRTEAAESAVDAARDFLAAAKEQAGGGLGCRGTSKLCLAFQGLG